MSNSKQQVDGFVGEVALYNNLINKLCQMSFAEELQVCSGFGVQGPRSAFRVEGEINLLLELAHALYTHSRSTH